MIVEEPPGLVMLELHNIGSEAARYIAYDIPCLDNRWTTTWQPGEEAAAALSVVRQVFKRHS